MSVFNGEPYLRESVESILSQTFRDFEFIIINDGSTDGTADILTHYQRIDPRLAVHHQQNKGLIDSLNTGCGLARGRYIARMDDDDVALPGRLERQISFLEQNPQVALLGTSVNIIDVSGRRIETLALPAEDELIRQWLFESRRAPFCHVTLVFRAEAFRILQGYRAAFVAAEDYDLWLRFAERWQVANLPEALVNVRRRAHSLSFSHVRQQVISILAASAASSQRRAGGLDPLEGRETVVSRELLRRLGVSDAAFEKFLMDTYQYWIGAMLQASDQAGALQVMREALESQSWKHINKSIVANTWLEAARIYFQQGRRLQGISCTARALAIRPIIAGRPVKRMVSRLGLLPRADGAHH